MVIFLQIYVDNGDCCMRGEIFRFIKKINRIEIIEEKIENDRKAPFYMMMIKAKVESGKIIDLANSKQREAGHHS